MDANSFDRDCLVERLQKYAAMRGVPEDQAVSLRLRPLQKDGSPAYVAWPSYEKAIELAGVSRVPATVPFFGAEYLPGGCRAYQPPRGDILWVPHETGLEIIGLVLGVVGAIEPTIKGFKWLVNKLMGKPEPDIYQPYPVDTIQLAARFLRNGQFHQVLILERIETIIEDEKAFVRQVEQRILSLTG
jgi:hypothetical protein